MTKDGVYRSLGIHFIRNTMSVLLTTVFPGTGLVVEVAMAYEGPDFNLTSDNIISLTSLEQPHTCASDTSPETTRKVGYVMPYHAMPCDFSNGALSPPIMHLPGELLRLNQIDCTSCFYPRPVMQLDTDPAYSRIMQKPLYVPAPVRMAAVHRAG